jgi:hypothetical protein
MPAADLLELPLRVEGYELEGLSFDVSTGFTRRTTVLRLVCGGEEGIGEDVTYMEDDQLAFQQAGPVLELAGEHTLDSFSRALPADLPDYRRWAFESAALDLALRQAGRSLAEAVGREPRPLSFVVSTREGIEEWRRLYPGLRFKLDAEDDWTDELVAGLAATSAVDTVDLKGHYRGTPVDLEPDPELYRRVCEGFPDAWIEDAWVDERTRPVLEPHAPRLTWDAPVHSVADAEALPFAPRCLNVKPSRFGSLRQLFELYAWCERRGVALYGGGQFELGPGRGQVQLLASLFHPDTPNDVAPREYNTGGPRPGLPSSPLTLWPRATGFLLERAE